MRSEHCGEERWVKEMKGKKANRKERKVEGMNDEGRDEGMSTEHGGVERKVEKKKGRKESE